MAENYKHLYLQMKKMVAMYQDEIVPGFRAKIEELEADNARLRDMCARVVSDLSVEKSKTKHGHWVYKPYEGDDMIWLYHCSVCQSPNARERNFCNTCGAVMDGELVDLSTTE